MYENVIEKASSKSSVSTGADFTRGITHMV